MDEVTLADPWAHGTPYDRYVGRWSRRVAGPFLAWLGVPKGRRWVDVGCGTGALSAAIVDAMAPGSVVGVDPSPGFLSTARSCLGPQADLRIGEAGQLPLPDASADAVVSGLVLNFVPDPVAALREMGRVAARGGTVAAYVWDYADQMGLMRHYWDAAVGLDPRASALDEGARFPLCRPQALEAAFARAGCVEVAVTGLTIDTPFADFEAYWSPFLGGQGPAPAHAMSLPEAARAALRERLRTDLPTAADGSIALTARAWAVRGRPVA